MAPRNFYRNQKIKRQEQKLVTKDDDDFSKKKSTKMMRKAKDRIERRNQDLLDADQDVIIIRRLERAEKTKQTHEALIKNIDDCEELSKIARSSLGPSGSHKLVFKLFLNELVVQLQHPAPKVLLLAAKQQLKKFGDGAVLVVSIAGQHLEGAKKLIKMGLNPRHIIHGYKKASKKVGEILEALVQEGSETMDVRNKDQVILRMNAPVSSKLYFRDHILSLIAEACIQVCPKNPVNFNVDNVRVARLLGVSLGASKTFRGMVLKVDTVAGSIKGIHDAKVLVIAGGVDTTDSEQDREPQSMFDRLMAEHHVGDQSLGQQHELPPKELLSIFYDSIWANNLQLKREVEMLAVKIHGDKLFGLSPDGRLSSFDIRSSKVCWSIPTDIALYLDFSFKSSESNCSYFVDSSRVFIHTQETKPVGFRYQKYEVCENRFGYLDEELIPSRLVTEIYFDPVEGCPINPLMSHCDEILIIRTVHGQLTSYKQETNIVLWYERVDTFYIWIVSREEGLKFQKEQLRLYQSRQRTVW
ncbi:Chaperone, tailless complex polypeptide 1 [Artemisia annua]|uniref:Chaperone, tailless complex polypeptide 1 n=1 Tax=Artemisia annua TaxID=35608 RepID=A0A2U1MAK6_ARTAN|nr:Chaperone, tailless complex polypeptide 1 [Artemisia annua]